MRAGRQRQAGPGWRRLLALGIALAVCAGGAHAADGPRPPADRQEPTEAAVWGAIAFSPVDGRHGLFWGAAAESEAVTVAMTHCRRAGGAHCAIVAIVSNARRGFAAGVGDRPARSCAALLVARSPAGSAPRWAAASAPTRDEAERAARAQCAARSGCELREWLCT